MKNLFLLLSILPTSFSYGQPDTITVIAKYNLYWFGDNYTYGNYTVLHTVQGTVSKKEITVASINGLNLNNVKDTVLLKIVHEHDDKNRSSFHFPNYDATNNSEKVKAFFIDHDFMEGCETGQGACETQVFTRDFIGQRAFIIMPCGGTFSTIQLHHKSKSSPVQEMSVEAIECPPFFDLTQLEDGDYSASMMSCGLGGAFKIQLKSNFPKKKPENRRISCECFTYVENYPEYNDTIKREISIEEVTQVPPISETMMDYNTNYELEKDSLGRVSKMIRTYYNDKTIETTVYVYNANNRLIREDIQMENQIASESMFHCRKERIDFYYDEKGNRIRKVRTVIHSPDKEFILEECFYAYNQ